MRISSSNIFMDINELKKLLKNSTSVLIMEQGNPELVIMDYSSYRNLVKTSETEIPISKAPQEKIASNGFAPNQTRPVLLPTDYNGGFPEPISSVLDKATAASTGNLQSRESEILERLNREIMLLKEQIELEEQKDTTVG